MHIYLKAIKFFIFEFEKKAVNLATTISQKKFVKFSYGIKICLHFFIRYTSTLDLNKPLHFTLTS